MIKFIRVEAEEYISLDERFHIIKVWDRINLIHWQLRDYTFNKTYVCYSLKHCKQIANKIINNLL